MGQGLLLLSQWVLEFTPIVIGLIQKKQEGRAVRSKLHQFGDLRNFIKGLNDVSSNQGMASDFEHEKKLQRQLAVYHRETQFKLAAYQRETTLQLPETHKILDNWPLRLYPSQILGSHRTQTLLPLKIFLAPPDIHSHSCHSTFRNDLDIEFRLAEGLREFLTQYYPLHSPIRPTEFLAGAWESKRFHSEASIKALFGMLQSEPTLILESEIDGDDLNFRVAYWGLGQEDYYYTTICKLPYRRMLYEAAKARALRWKAIRDELLESGEDLVEVNQMGGDNVANLDLLEKETKWQAKGIDVSQLSLNYQINREDVEQFCQVLINSHCLVAGWIADTYHLVHQNVSPVLPSQLPKLVQDVIDSRLIQAIASGYQQIYQALAHEQRYWIPELSVQLAQSLTHLPDKTWAQAQLDYSIQSWLNLRQVAQPLAETALETIKTTVTLADRDYVEQLQTCFIALGDCQSADQAAEILAMLTPEKISSNPTPQLLGSQISPIGTLTGHSGQRLSLAIAPDGETLVSSCLDKTIKVWNLRTVEVTRTLTGHSKDISSVAISPDGQFLATSSLHCPKSNVKVWNLQTGKLLHSSLGHKKSVQFITIANDGRVLVSSSNKVKIWDLHTGDRLCTLWNSCPVNTATLSPDGQQLVTGRRDGKIKFWNPYTGEPIRTFNGHDDAVTSIVFYATAQMLISGSVDRTIKIWNLQTGKVMHTLDIHPEGVNSIALIPDTQIVVSGGDDGTIKLWHLDTGELWQTLTGHTGAVTLVAVSPNGQMLVSGSTDRTIKIWRLL
jgi:hypothetical protein